MKYVERINQKFLCTSFDSHFVTAVLGPRQVGKSTLVNHYLEQHPEYKWVTINMDALLERDRVEQGGLRSLIEEKAQEHLGKTNKLWIYIEEAQKCPQLFDQVKLLYDQYKESRLVKFILTGSASLSLHQLSAESLAGRIQLFYLHEFSLRELANLQNSKILPVLSPLDLACQSAIDFDLLKAAINEVTPYRQVLEKALEDQLTWGGLPELYLLNNGNSEKINYLANYLHTYLEKDVRAVTSISDLHLYRKLINVIAEQTGSVRQDTRIQQALGGCHAETLKKYRGFLEATLMYNEIYPYIGSSLKRLVKAPKGYLCSNGLISLITGLYDFAMLTKTGLIGHRVENWFLKELQIWLARTPGLNQIDFWRTSGGAEVDFVVSKPPQVFPFEITYALRPESKKIRNLQTFIADEKRATVGYYLYNGSYHFDAERKICFLPLWSIA